MKVKPTDLANGSCRMGASVLPVEADVPYELVQQLLHQILSTKTQLVDYQIGNRRHDYLVLLLRLRHPSLQVVVKLAGPEAAMASEFERTAMLHRLVAAHTTIPMSEVLAVDTTCRAWPWRYFVKTWIPGLEWAVAAQRMGKDELSSAYRQIGHAVAQLHNLGFPAFGELPAAESGQGPETYLAALTEHARHIITQPHLQDLFFSALDKLRNLFLDVRQACLCHEDLHKHNILFQYRARQWHLATILDFDKAWAGHHETDLARLDLWKGMTSREFWRSYRASHAVEPLYEQRRPVYQLLWCLECAWPTREHLADTQRLCTELGLARLERFE